MALARVYSAAAGGIQTTLQQAFADRLDRDSDIREYLPYLHDTAKAYPACRVLELGTRKGNSTLAFLAAVEPTRGHVWSVDIDNVTRVPDGMGPWAGCPLWTFTHGDDLHPAVAAAQPPEVDVLFIDTTHFYDHTLEELRLYAPRVAPGGVILCHDTKLLVWEALAGPEPEQVPPVRRALGDWCAETGRVWEEIPGEYGLGVVRIG